MPEGLRGFISQKLTTVGVQLQVLWQETLMSDQPLKQAPSPPSSPQSTNSQITEPNDEPIQEIILPVFTTPDCNDSDAIFGDTDQSRSLREHKTVENAPSAGPPAEAPTATTKHAASQTEDSPNHPAENGSATCHTLLPYANAVTQTEPWTPGLARSLRSAVDENNAELDVQSDAGSQAPLQYEDVQEADLITHNEDISKSLDIPGGPSRIVLAKHDNEDCPALLVTKEVIWRMAGISEETRKVERLEHKVEKLERKVTHDMNCVGHNENLLEDAVSQDEVDRLQKVAGDPHINVAPYKDRLEILKNELADARQNQAYLQGLFQDSLMKALTDTGLLKDHNEQVDGEAEDDESPESELELYPDETQSIQSEISDISLEELNRRATSEELRLRHAELLEAENQFEMRHENYDLTKARYLDMLREGECEMTPTEFDHCDVEATRELTKELRLAEEAYEEALARRNALGPNESDQESGFVDDEDDGYRLSFENDGSASAPTKFIRKWLEGIPDVEDIPDMEALDMTSNAQCGRARQEGDDDCDIRSARMSDGWSCRDWTRNRRRIDRWRTIAGRSR
ncbi:MAG: hypothetical protein Q9209_007052 [Squamulea sp. 1 TL-2023]